MTRYDHDPDEGNPGEDDPGEHIEPDYEPPRISRGSDPISGASAAMSVCGVAFAFGALADGPPPWLLTIVMLVSGTGLILACRAWWRAVTAPRRENW